MRKKEGKGRRDENKKRREVRREKGEERRIGSLKQRGKASQHSAIREPGK